MDFRLDQKLVPGFPGIHMAACPRLASLLPLSNLASGGTGGLLAAELDDAFERALFVTNLPPCVPFVRAEQCGAAGWLGDGVARREWTAAKRDPCW